MWVESLFQYCRKHQEALPAEFVIFLALEPFQAVEHKQGRWKREHKIFGCKKNLTRWRALESDGTAISQKRKMRMTWFVWRNEVFGPSWIRKSKKLSIPLWFGSLRIFWHSPRLPSIRKHWEHLFWSKILTYCLVSDQIQFLGTSKVTIASKEDVGTIGSRKTTGYRYWKHQRKARPRKTPVIGNDLSILLYHSEGFLDHRDKFWWGLWSLSLEQGN